MLPQSYDFAFTQAAIGMALISLEGTILNANPALYDLLGYTPPEISSSPLHFIEDDIIIKIIQVGRSLQSDHRNTNSQPFEQEYNHPLGQKISLHIHVSMVLDNNKVPLHYLAQFENSTKIKYIEKQLQEVKSALHENENFLQQMLEELSLTVLITKHGIIKYVNPAGLQLIYADSLDEVLGKSTDQFVDTSSHNTLLERREKYHNNKELGSVHYLIRCLNGHKKYVEGFSLQITFKGQDAVIGIFKDITKQEAEKERTMQSEKLSTAGQLAAGIAHEIRNPLTAINGFMKLLRSSKDKSDQYITIIESELKRIEFIVNELLVLSKPQRNHTSTPLNVISLLDQVIILMNGQASLRNIQILTQYPDKQFVIIMGVANQLKQVFINLLKNALEAMNHGGTIHVYLQIKDNEVQISVQDQGYGMTEDQIKALGEPFYTTKDTGTGLGFMITQNIIHNHGGVITVDSIPEQGTTFTVSLPQIVIADRADL
ncbi:ATP-binding protein [Paenibacillus gallinarum]|uniref:histidine kinase n=1 Tax=Paenibacillus gallinarum TaxID=2762232 RepID=A0ABR8SXK0_9BACL|nr:ATP-binding protein [Paenibacillus gallinarum]MBD7968130.1 PAS domain S-box protein [Paenibacillus gallinarum]